MNLRETAESDMSAILSDFVTGPGWPITITNPAGVSKPINGLTNDISNLIDPETGQAVSGRLATIAVSISGLAALGLGIPQGIEAETSKPWVVSFNDINGIPYTFKVQSSNPDRAIGLVTCNLELYT